MRQTDERFWYAFAATGTFVELHALRRKNRRGTLSYAGRKALRCQTKTGRFFLYAGWACLTAWLLPHLSNDVSETIGS